ncbi:bifunctional phosphopantothenoylcysteine decarboxylase/phosphopantothenate--cysteine ligase CoaBC [Aerococcaceae bacterium WS4759]|uniref:Coenzyme A biosynthesis bifunctional protein CoaBC n=1 Tax=Fundicoccus ignavus TaxID=2664442 RepID=A0A6I2GPJ1_9LACT|nr:bifunctional phosphopantothenoylcysteine decarboxylase/phosphopantothenate--cysteine ligase CoaBC [Fundicoccus ignavus]MRI86418.1 bifunctional phosphopantothenoylcysteine decarboxylase/phosphopantothenate--cysteine ligase CoaBC [Fundicoccus ignavus]
MLENKKIALFITGGIASYKMAEFTRQLIKKGAQVRVVMSKSAQEFITPLTLQILTKHYVLVDTFDEHDPTSVQHIELADWCDLAIVAPATANILAKMANGLADDIVSSVLLAVHCPRLLVPAMNTNMYDNPATQRNLKQLAEDGYEVMEPDTGFLAEGYEGKGRLPELERIVERAELLMARTSLPQVLSGKRVLVTAGGTVERIDPVRYISNDSSGKMGYAMARVASWLGADVQLVSTNRALATPLGVAVQYVESAQEMQAAVTSEFAQLDYVVKAAAVSDYRVRNARGHKMKKAETGSETTIELVENPDILAGLGAMKEHQIVIGFAAETQNLLEYAQAKLQKKNADWIIANDVSEAGAGFNVETNRVTIIGKENLIKELKHMSKLDTALAVWKTITGIE